MVWGIEMRGPMSLLRARRPGLSGRVASFFVSNFILETERFLEGRRLEGKTAI